MIVYLKTFYFLKVINTFIQHNTFSLSTIIFKKLILLKMAKNNELVKKTKFFFDK